MVATRRSSGLTIVIEHGEGLYSMFDHLSRADVAAGARVAAGDTIGATHSGSATRWHARLHNEDVDPQSLVYAAGGTDDVFPRAQ
jgi:murein DD-endopeptidase MepM/ murein hydrolase activator NlpD